MKYLITRSERKSSKCESIEVVGVGSTCGQPYRHTLQNDIRVLVHSGSDTRCALRLNGE